MTHDEHLLTILAEECSEVALASALLAIQANKLSQRVSKALRFGLGEVQKDQDRTNEERIVEEFDDLCAVVYLLQKRGHLPSDGQNGARIEAKMAKVAKFLAYSAERGTLKEDGP